MYKQNRTPNNLKNCGFNGHKYNFRAAFFFVKKVLHSIMIKVNNKLIFESGFTLSRTRPSIYTYKKPYITLPSLQIVLQNYILRLSSTCQKLYQQKIVKVKEYILTKATHNIHIFVLFKRLCAIIFQGHVLN